MTLYLHGLIFLLCGHKIEISNHIVVEIAEIKSISSASAEKYFVPVPCFVFGRQYIHVELPPFGTLCLLMFAILPSNYLSLSTENLLLTVSTYGS